MASICTDAAEPHSQFSPPGQVLFWLGVTVALVIVAYFFVDQPLMAFGRSLSLDRYAALKWLTKPPEAFVLLSPIVLLVGFIKRWFSPWTRLETVAVAAAVSTLLTAFAVLLLKMTFGRSSDGFHPFHVGSAFWAFPSGHTACTLSVTAVAQIAYPRLRMGWWALAGMVSGMLIVLNHHFLGDIIAGIFVGWAIGSTSSRMFGLTIR